MDGHKKEKLTEHCLQVLKTNDLGSWTRPAPNLYPHQWLWDSCFIAIGQRHYDIKRAEKEIKSLFRGQWKDGMIPNLIMAKQDYYEKKVWNSSISPEAPKKVKTSGITQPPMIAEAIVKIGEKMNRSDRIKWYRETYPNLLKFHEWIYRERDPRGEGLALLVHPWECGLDNNPTWTRELRLNHLPLWIRIVKNLRLHKVFNVFRHDTKYLPAYQRIDVIDALTLFSIARRLGRKKYDTRLILRHAPLLIEDLAFNSILIRANTHLTNIAADLKEEIPGWLWERMKKAPHALELLWNEADQQYYSRNFTTFEAIDEPSIMTFLPLYAGTISKTRAAHLVDLLKSKAYQTKYPVPSVPKNSPYFSPVRYWQGPTWINTNWLIADGLKRYGYDTEADHIVQRSLELVAQSESYEYFSPLDGSPAGARNFSWTAALALDFLLEDHT